MTHITHWAKTKFLKVPGSALHYDRKAEMMLKKKEIQLMIAKGMNNEEMAEALGITPQAVVQRRNRKQL